MAYGKRKRSSSAMSRKPYAKRARTAATRGRTGYAGVLRASVRRASMGVKRLNSMIETKESTQVTSANVALPHNNIYETGINPFITNPGTGDPMSGTGNRIGDKISCRGLLIKGFMENALGRNRVHYRVMLVRGAKGESFTRANLFKGIVNNKMIDQLNTERFTIVASTKFTITGNSGIADTVTATGVPNVSSTSLFSAAQCSKAWQMWVPGRKFGKYGTLIYENASTSQVKFYDYRIVIVAYDWYGTPQDLNNVGKINEMYTKLYFKDA